jgi:hypothetical protein
MERILNRSSQYLIILRFVSFLSMTITWWAAWVPLAREVAAIRRGILVCNPDNETSHVSKHNDEPLDSCYAPDFQSSGMTS